MNEQKWLKTKDNPPPKEGCVLGWDTFYKDMHICEWFRGKLMPCNEEEDDVSIDLWMPLPDPPDMPD